jgi:hypothetical protein
MSNHEYRHPQIPHPTGIVDKIRHYFDKESFERLLGDKVLTLELDKSIETYLESLEKNPFHELAVEINRKNSKENILKDYELEKNNIVKFLKEEIFSILSELKLLKDSRKIFIEFSNEETKNRSASILIKDEGIWLTLDIKNIIHLFRKSSLSDFYPNYIKAQIVNSLSHEFFHQYISNLYKKTDEKNTIANQANRAGNPELYQKDRAEIACELYAAHHLEQRAQQVKLADAKFSEFLSARAKETREDVQQRLATSETTSATL